MFVIYEKPESNSGLAFGIQSYEVCTIEIDYVTVTS